MAWELTLALVVVAVLVAAVVAFLAAELWLARRVLPGIQVWDVDLGGLSREEATRRLEAQLRYPPDRHPVLRYGDQAWQVAPQDLGARLDAAASVDAALAVGHSGPWSRRLKEQADVLLHGRLVMPVLTADPAGGAVLLTTIANQLDRPLRNASLRLGEGLRVELLPGQAGRSVDREATRLALLQRMGELSGGEVPLLVSESEPLLTDVASAQAQVQQILGAPVRLTAPGFPDWVIQPETLAGWLILRPVTGADGKTVLAVSLDRAQVAALVEQIAGQVAREPANARFRWDDGSGALVPAVESVTGLALNREQAANLLEAAAQGDQRSVPLPLDEIRPALASEDGPGLGIVELIGEGVTQFAGSSAARVQNITVGAAQFDGLLIGPGETFSFNHYLGEVSAERGYAEGIIIWGNTTRADVGGGLCQVSSTAFRAAFWAGLPIVERTAHAFRVSYYEPPKGLDATIYSPAVDLKWKNDTGHYILVHTWVDPAAQTLTFRYYGMNPGRTVEMDGPYEENPVPHGPDIYRDDPTLPKGEKKQIEWAKDGLDVTVYRVVKQSGVEVQREPFFSRYLPWQAVYLVGTKE